MLTIDDYGKHQGQQIFMDAYIQLSIVRALLQSVFQGRPFQLPARLLRCLLNCAYQSVVLSRVVSRKTHANGDEYLSSSLFCVSLALGRSIFGVAGLILSGGLQMLMIKYMTV